MLAHVVFMEDAADPVDTQVSVVANPVELSVACDADPSDDVDFLADACFSANLISFHFTFHHESLSSASRATFLYTRKTIALTRAASAIDKQMLNDTTGNPSE